MGRQSNAHRQHGAVGLRGHAVRPDLPIEDRMVSKALTLLEDVDDSPLPPVAGGVSPNLDLACV